MSVPQYLKGKLSEEFPESDPLHIREISKCAYKYEIAERWASDKQGGKSTSSRVINCSNKSQNAQNNTSRNKQPSERRTIIDSDE